MLLTALGLAFAVLNGLNDGGALVAASLKAPGIRPLTGIAVLAVAMGVVPIVVGVRVAETLAGGLVPAAPERQTLLMGIAVVAAFAVVALLNAKGLPTSLTLALVGGLVGAGLGQGQPVAWPLVGATAAAGVAAPAVGGVIGSVVRRSARFTGTLGYGRRRLGRHYLPFGLQAVAYAANDGQKVYAVLAAGLLAGAADGGLAGGVPAWQLVAVPVCFALGAIVGVRPMTRSLGAGGVLRTRPRDEVAAEVSSSAAVLGSAAVGLPVSMTQSMAGSLIGAGMTRGTKRVRWRAAGRLGMAWVLTLPASAAAGAVLAIAEGALR